MAHQYTEAVKKVLDLVGGLDAKDQVRLLDGVAVVLGHQRPSDTKGGGGGGENGGGGSNHVRDGNSSLGEAAPYMAGKQPSNKQEELACAARFRHLKHGVDAHTKEELQAVFVEASVNFDTHNFNRDLENAKISGLFLRGPSIKLSYNGNQFVDALPDRDAAAKFKKKPRAKKKATKKTGKKGSSKRA